MPVRTTNAQGEKTQESDGSWVLLSIKTKALSLGSGLSLDGRQSCQRPFDLFNFLVFGACHHPFMGTAKGPAVGDAAQRD